MHYDPKAKDVYDFGYEYDGLPKALTPAQRAKCIHYLNPSFRYNNSYERLGSILNTYLPMDILYACLGYEWTVCDNIASHGRTLQMVLQIASRKQRHLMMNDKELEEWHKLPDTLTIYRYCYANNQVGFSYSLNKEVAESFTTYLRYQQQGNKQKYIVTASFPKQYAVLKLGREEEEIIVTHLGRVKTLKRERISPEQVKLFSARNAARKQKKSDNQKLA